MIMYKRSCVPLVCYFPLRVPSVIIAHSSCDQPSVLTALSLSALSPRFRPDSASFMNVLLSAFVPLRQVTTAEAFLYRLMTTR